MKPKRITSTANNAVKEAVRLKRKKHRQARRLFLAEGEDLLEAAVAGGYRPRQVFVLEGAVAPDSLPGGLPGQPETEVYSVSEAVIGRISSHAGNPRLVAVFDCVDTALPGARRRDGTGIFLYLAGLADPGNIGSLLRSAAALGAEGVVLSEATADPYCAKAVQASVGAIFSIPLHYGPAGVPELLRWAAELDLEPIGADQQDGAPAWDVDLTGGVLLLLGAERTGLPDELRQQVSGTVRIPQREGIESLNVAMAATALLYEAARQRGGA